MANSNIKTQKKKRSTLKKLAILSAGLGAAYFAAGNALFEAFMTQPDLKRNQKDSYVPAPSDVQKYKAQPNSIDDPKEWFFAFTKKTPLISLRGETIIADIIEQNTKTHKWAICCHGYTSRPSFYAQRGYEIFKMGFNILYPNLNGHGSSEKRYATMGWHDRLDILDWITYILTLDPKAEIILYGVSMGAATVMMTTGEDLPKNVKCAIEDCGYTSVWDEFHSQIGNEAHLPAFPFLNAARTVTKLRLKYDLKEASALNAVMKSSTPTLFIHGGKDDFVPFWMLDVLYDNAVCEKEKLIIEGAEHARAHEVNPELYWGSIKSFVDKYVS